MKILCVIDNLSSGGSQRQLVNLAIGFKERGNDISFLVYHDLPFYNSIIEKNGISINCLTEQNYIKRLIKIRRFIRKGYYDAVVSFLDAPNFICEISGLPFRKWKLVVGERSANPNIYRSIKLMAFQWFHCLADHLVSNSYSNMKIVQSVNPLLSKAKCTVIPNIVDFTIWKPIKEYYPRKDGKLKLVIIASHQYLKNLNGFVDALILLTRDELGRINVEWYGDRITEPFINDSFPKAKLKVARYSIENTIKFYPPTDSILKIIQEADAIGLFSFYEGLPNSVCEGMACAKPIICSAVSDLPKLIDYDDNLLCNPSDPESIKTALRYLINLDDQQLINCGRKNLSKARNLFGKDKIVEAYLKILNK